MKYYQRHLFAYCIMPNHVHLVIKLFKDSPSLIGILQSLKGRTSFLANKILKRTGSFWQHESYDHIIRDEEEYTRIINYVMGNPVKAGLVKKAEDWKWSYCKMCENERAS